MYLSTMPKYKKKGSKKPYKMPAPHIMVTKEKISNSQASQNVHGIISSGGSLQLEPMSARIQPVDYCSVNAVAYGIVFNAVEFHEYNWCS